MNAVETWAVAIGAILAIVGGLWRGVIRPGIRVAGQVDSYGPVLTSIAREFKNDGGSTLKDDLSSIRSELATIRAELADLRRATHGIGDDVEKLTPS